MAQSTKELIIKLNGQVSTGAGKVADKLNEIGSILERVGAVTREFEEESTEIYRNYEDNMLATRFALSAKVKDYTELNRQMQGLGEAAQKWASTTIFHTDDVSKAILEATRAGWSYEEVLQGIPAAMLIAQAGGMDLSQGLDYIVKMLNTTGTEFGDLQKMVDQWAMAANSSATSIDEMGEAFMSLSSSAMFANNTQELFTLVAVLANAGVTGTKAGTLLRSAMMRLVAPTEKAKKAMADLGATEEELSEWAETDETAEHLKKLGFSAYTESGELKPMRDILISLHDALDGMTAEQQYDILSTIFPLRSINAATAFMKSIESGKLTELYEAIGESGGYAQEGADIMMSGLTGAIETLKSKWEEFERKIGETLAPHIENIAGFLGQIVDGFNNMDPAQMEGLTSMLTALSTTGPLLIGVAAVAKLVSVLTPIGALAAAAALGVAYLVGYLGELNEINFEGKFGTLQTDLGELGDYVDGVKSKFDLEAEQLEAFKKNVDEAQKKYEETMNGLNEGILKKVLKGEAFTDDDFAVFTELGDKMVEYTNKGIDEAQARDNSFLRAIFGDKSSTEEAEAFESAAQMLDWYYSDLSAEATAIGEGIRQTMTKALANGELTDEDREAIQAQVDRLNKIQAEIANRAREQEYYTQLNKAGRVSWDTVEGFLKDNETKLTAAEQSINEQYDQMSGIISAAYARARKEGGDITYTDINGNKVTISGADVSEAAEKRVLDQIERERAASLEAETRKFGDFSARAFETLMNDSDFGDAWKFLNELYGKTGELPRNANGTIDLSGTSLDGMDEAARKSLAKQLTDLFSNDSTWLGLGTGKLSEVLEPFKNYEGVAQMLEMVRQSANVGRYVDRYNPNARRDELSSELARLESERDRYNADIQAREDYLNGNVNWSNWLLTEQAARGSLYGTNGQNGIIAMRDRLNQEIEAVKAKLAAEEARLSLMGQGASVNIGEGGLTEIMGQINGEEGVELVADVYGDTTELNAAIMDENGQVLEEKVVGNAAELDALLATYQGKTVHVKLQGYGLLGGAFASGGRADTPSIFGEAGPEWAIPEEHSQRTAELLDAARRGAGFTWGDLISRYGGLNANPQNNPVVLNYNPVINANDTGGIAQTLAADKDRLIKMIRQALDETRYRQQVEAYA